MIEMLSLFELLSSLFLPIAGGIFGYGLREYESRARPFIQVTYITGSRKEPGDKEHVEAGITDKLSGLSILPALDEDSSIGDIDFVFAKADTIHKNWPLMKEEISKLMRFLERGDEEEVKRSLGRIFKIPGFSDTIVTFLIFAFEWEDTTSASVSANQQKQRIPKIHSYLAGDGNAVFIRLSSGIYILPSPNTYDYKDPIVRENLDPWLEAIKYLDGATLTAVFARYVEVMDKEYAAASSIISQLDSILKKNARWFLSIYLANLSKTPIVIEDHAWIDVIDNENGVKFHRRESCEVRPRRGGSDGPESTPAAIVVEAGKSVNFFLITESAQKKMEYGSDLRTIFEEDKRKGQYRLLFNMRKVGVFLSKQKISHGPLSFAETGSKSAKGRSL